MVSVGPAPTSHLQKRARRALDGPGGSVGNGTGMFLPGFHETFKSVQAASAAGWSWASAPCPSPSLTPLVPTQVLV